MWLVRIVTPTQANDLVVSYCWFMTPFRTEAIRTALETAREPGTTAEAICNLSLPPVSGRQAVRARRG